MAIARDVPLAPFTTFELGGPARVFVEATSEAELLEALSFARRERLEVLILGGGSNLVVADRGFDGFVIRMACRGVTARDEGARTLLEVAAGEPWDAVRRARRARRARGRRVPLGHPRVGRRDADPERRRVRPGGRRDDRLGPHRRSSRPASCVERTNAECAFRYRHSIFKEPAGKREVVTRVTFALARGGSAGDPLPRARASASRRRSARSRRGARHRHRAASEQVDGARSERSRTDGAPARSS